MKKFVLKILVVAFILSSVCTIQAAARLATRRLLTISAVVGAASVYKSVAHCAPALPISTPLIEGRSATHTPDLKVIYEQEIAGFVHTYSHLILSLRESSPGHPSYEARRMHGNLLSPADFGCASVYAAEAQIRTIIVTQATKRFLELTLNNKESADKLLKRLTGALDALHEVGALNHSER